MSQHMIAPRGSRGAPKRASLYVSAAAVALSAFAAASVLGNVAAGVPRQADENAWAHLYQIAMIAQLPLLALSLAVADWTRRGRVFLLLLVQCAAAAAALGALAWSGYCRGLDGRRRIFTQRRGVVSGRA